MKRVLVSFRGERVFVPAQVVKGQVWFQWGGRTFLIPLKARREAGGGQAQSPPPPTHSLSKKGGVSRVLAPVPGKVVEVLVRPGQTVKKNQPLFVLSSMKMEHTLHSPCTGRVKLLKIREGGFVKGGSELAQIQAS